MHAMIEWFARNGVAANLMMVFIVASGLLAATSANEEVFPEMELDRISVEVPYLGAAPEEVESAVNVRIEEAIEGIDGIKQIRSTAYEGAGSVTIELDLGADARRVVDEVKNNVDAITTFPVDTEKPIVRELTNRLQVVDIAVSGDMDPFTLKQVTERVRDELTAIPGITQVDIVSAPPYEISIEVSENALRRHALTFDQVADAVRRSSLDLPGGSVRTEGGEILLRTIGQAYRGAEFEDLILWTRPDGSRLRLGDVATVVDGFEETDQYARFDFEPTMLVSVFRTGDQSAVEIAALATAYVERARGRLPEGVTLTVWQNDAESLNNQLSLMLRNGVAGFALVFLVLALFLELRLAFWVSLGIPISFFGAIALMPGVDVSVNVLSLFGFVLVLGIVVDDAIIVGENIYRHQEEHGDGMRGAIEGAYEIAKPVTFAVLTTVAAFSPLLFVPGTLGKVFRVIPLVVIACLLFSLLESLNILPAHLSHIPKRVRPGPWRRFQRVFANGLTHLAHRVYSPLLETALRWRYVTASVGVGVMVVTIGMVLAGRPGFRFMPSIEANVISASVTMPQGAPVEATAAAVAKLEAGAARLRRRLLEETGRDYFRHVLAAVGDRPMAARGGGPTGPAVGSFTSPNTGEGGDRAAALGSARLRQRAARPAVARGDRADPGSRRGRLRAGQLERGQRCRRAARRPGRRRSAGRGGGGQAAPPRLRRRLRGDRLVPRRQAGDEARHQAGRRNRRPHPREPWAPGAPGVLRRGGPAHPAGPRRRTRHGPLSARRAPLARRPSRTCASGPRTAARCPSAKSRWSSPGAGSRRSGAWTATGRSIVTASIDPGRDIGRRRHRRP